MNSILLIDVLLCSLTNGHDIDVEKLLDGEYESQDQSALVEYLESLLENPINVNEASARELSTLPWLSSTVAIRIVHYRYKKGAFNSVDDVKKVRGVTKVFQEIRPFLTVGKRRLSYHMSGRHRIVFRAEDSKAFQQNIYLGSKEKMLNSVKGMISNHVQFGLLSEKDAGEQFLDDLRTGHLLIDVPFLPTRICIGHFSAGFGRGLVFGGPYRMNGGSDVLSPAKQTGRGIVPYLTVTENKAFWGVALSSRQKLFELHAFTSTQKRNARIENGLVFSLPQSGLHRTINELETYRQLDENVRGFSLEMNVNRGGRIGGALQTCFYKYPFSKKGGPDQYDFYGSSNRVLGVYFDQTVASMNIFAEIAQSESRGRALIIGLCYDWATFDFVSFYRWYEKNFQNFYAQGFGKSATTSNESGFYFGLRYQVCDGTTVLISFDQYKSMWPQRFDPMPGSGCDALCYLECRFSSQLCVSVRYRTTTKYTGETEADQYGNLFREIHRPSKSNLRLQMDYKATKKIQSRSRLELSLYSEHECMLNRQQKAGILLYQDFRWQFHRLCRVQTRWTFFDAPAYDVRLYQYENDVPGVMRIKMLNGRGARWYIVASLQLAQHLQVHVKYENIYIDDDTSIGSGNDRIDSAYENVYSCQLDWHF
ncbi:helix-hairpin-helix domain-containing protein [candidate division KSB1 bacterium]|nr:helix-hairpin-helix domain-containing protein [candidate division KSB1 bacterium]